MTEPASLHPIINSSLCLGCGVCTKACPEGGILGLINGKARLVEPANCIGHGACKTACPFDAITLVFGTEKRGVDIPQLSPNFETNVCGLFIAGELGGMGLIRNAIEQGKQAVDSIVKFTSAKHSAPLDLLIVGAGPAGIAASLTAKAHKLNFVTIDQATFGGTVSQFPRNKIVMTAPVELPLVGKMSFREITKEALLDFWEKIIVKTKLDIRYREQLLEIVNSNNSFKCVSTNTEYHSRAVLLCLGRRGTPRKLEVTGEELPKVVYRLIDPAQYRNQKVLVVGGSDSALEAAISISEEPGTDVTLAYRGEAISRAKPENREKLVMAANNGKLSVLFNTHVKTIQAETVFLKSNEVISQIENDAVIVCAGGILPTPFLKSLGIIIETKHGSA